MRLIYVGSSFVFKFYYLWTILNLESGKRIVLDDINIFSSVLSCYGPSKLGLKNPVSDQNSQICLKTKTNKENKLKKYVFKSITL